MGRRHEQDIFPKKTYRWPKDICKDAQHHSSSGKYKTKLQCDVTSHMSKWLKLTQETTGVGEDAEKEDLFCTAGGNAN